MKLKKAILLYINLNVSILGLFCQGITLDNFVINVEGVGGVVLYTLRTTNNSEAGSNILYKHFLSNPSNDNGLRFSNLLNEPFYFDIGGETKMTLSSSNLGVSNNLSTSGTLSIGNVPVSSNFIDIGIDDNGRVVQRQPTIPFNQRLEESKLFQKLNMCILELEEANYALEKRIHKLEEIISPEMEAKILDYSQNLKPNLSQNKPNPYSEDTVIEYSIPNQNSNAELIICDLSGKMLKSIQLNHNEKEIIINKDTLLSGIYLYSLLINNQVVDTKKMVIKN